MNGKSLIIEPVLQSEVERRWWMGHLQCPSWLDQFRNRGIRGVVQSILGRRHRRLSSTQLPREARPLAAHGI